MEQMRLDEVPGAPTVPVAGATEVPTQLYFCRLIQICSSNNFSRYWMIWWSRGNVENLRSHLLMPKKPLRVAASIKRPNHIIFPEHKRLSCVPHFIPPAVVICHVNRYIMHKCCLFIVNSRSGGGHLIRKLRGFWCPSIFLDFVTSGTFLPRCSFMSFPSLKVSCLFSMMTISGSKKISSEKTSE